MLPIDVMKNKKYANNYLREGERKYNLKYHKI